MKMVSKLALAAALTLGVATPAAAQKPKPQEEPKLQVSAAFRKPAADAENALKMKDWGAAETALVTAEGVAKNDDEKYYAAFMRLRIEVHKQNRPGIIRAADALIASPKTPPAHLIEYNYLRGQATFMDGKRGDAVPFLLKARELGSTEIDLPFMLAQAYDDAGKPIEGVAEMEKAIAAVKAKGQKPQESWYRWALSRVYKAGDRSAAGAWGLRQVQEFPTIANWRQVIVLYRDSVDKAGIALDKAEKIDLFRLMRGTGALADQADYFDYSNMALQSGLPWESIAVIAEGRTAGKIPKAQPDFARVESTAQTAAKNEGSLDTLARDAKTGKDFVATGDAYLASDSFARAVEMYDRALAVGGVDTDAVNLHRGVALVRLGRKDEARTAFAAVKGAPLADIAKYWVTWMDLPPLS